MSNDNWLMWFGRDHVDVSMRHLVTGDDHTDPLAVEHLLLGLADPMDDVEHVSEQVVGSVDPVVDLSDRHHQHVTPRQRVDRHERNASFVAMHERSGNLTGDDSTEDGCHDPNVRSA